jgi:hypothetical protein
MVRGRVLRIYDTKAVFENLDADSLCLLVSQGKDGNKQFDKFQKKQSPELGTFAQAVSFEAIYGFYDLLSGPYVALIVESESYVNIPNVMDMRRAKKIVVAPLFKNGRSLPDNKQRDEDRYLQLLNLAFSEHTFYFSYTSDITVCQQRLVSVKSSDPVWARADLRFFWNRDLIEDLIVHQANEWIIPIMSGYVETRDTVIDDVKVTFLFISRRARYRQGCRFTKRGADENGNTANFVETEQVLVFPDGRVSSYVQIRGSIPVKWISPVHMRYDPVVFIDEDRNLSLDAARKHMLELTEKYSDDENKSTIILINLIDRKKDQLKLGSAYQETIEAIKSLFGTNQLNFIWFDFHHECKQKGKWNNLAKLVKEIENNGGYKPLDFFMKLSSGKVISWQKGVIRTNCMDNLDRTNVVQSLFARRSLIAQMNRYKDQSPTTNMLSGNVLDTPWKPFEVMFKTTWTNNANAMSLGYAGTGALKVDFTKTGKRTFKGMINDGINSCMRYYINNFTDGIKQDAIDLMLGRYRPSITTPSPFSQRTSQEGLTTMATVAFTLLLFIFSSSLLLLPPIISLPFTTNADGDIVPVDPPSPEESLVNDSDILDRNFKQLQQNLLISVVVTLMIVVYLAYKIIKKGSKIGEMLVIHPELCPEKLPAGRDQANTSNKANPSAATPAPSAPAPTVASSKSS